MIPINRYCYLVNYLYMEQETNEPGLFSHFARFFQNFRENVNVGTFFFFFFSFKQREDKKIWMELRVYVRAWMKNFASSESVDLEASDEGPFILEFRNSGRRRIYSIAETRDTLSACTCHDNKRFVTPINRLNLRPLFPDLCILTFVLF